MDLTSTPHEELLIDIKNSMDLYYWSVILKISPKELRTVVKKVGNNVKTVKEFINNACMTNESPAPAPLHFTVQYIYDQYGKMMYAVTLKIISPAEEAEKCFLHIFEKLLNPLNRVYNKSDLFTLLCQLCEGYISENKIVLKRNFTNSLMLNELLFENMFIQDVFSSHPPISESICQKMQIRLSEKVELYEEESEAI
jgi:hypothetical protein